MGMLLERVEGRSAGIQDLGTCESLAKKVHAAGLVHGDLNRYNFIIGKNNSWLMDFENSREYERELADRELEGLTAQLVEETGRGGPATTVDA
ncbi:MAG: hypothetical protein M1831_001052 [Alyxoria varia]|nr:MAG: hypothetical protein M1831_001052 [Alyxoria varia]